MKSNTNEEVTTKSDTNQKYSTEKANEDSIKKEIRGTLEAIVFELGNLIIWANLIREGEVQFRWLNFLI